jgi:hypothetical protein
MNIFNSNDNNGQTTTKTNSQFVQSQILIDCLLRMRSDRTFKSDFISRFKVEYSSDKRQLEIIHEFERDYL